MSQVPRTRIGLSFQSADGVNVVTPFLNRDTHSGKAVLSSTSCFVNGNGCDLVADRDEDNNTIARQDPAIAKISPRHPNCSMSGSIHCPQECSVSPVPVSIKPLRSSIKHELFSNQSLTDSSNTGENASSLSSPSSSSSCSHYSSPKSSCPLTVSAIAGKSPISQLQEVCVLHGLGLPIYTEAGMMGPPHERMFSMSVKAAGVSVEGRGLTKKAAKTEAARIALQLMREESARHSENGLTILDVLDGKVNPTSSTGNPVNGLKHLTGMMESMSVGDPSPAEDHYVVQNLYAFCGRNGFSSPEYEEISVQGTSHDPLFTIRVAVRSLDVSATATGRSKIAAKRIAASELLAQLRDQVPDSGEGKSLKASPAVASDLQDLEYKHRLKYRIPTAKHAAPSIMFELFRQIENSKLPQFDECIKRGQAKDHSFDHFEALSQICMLLCIKAETHENEALSKTSGITFEALIMLSYKEIPIMTTYASSETSRDLAIQEAAFRSVISLCCSQRLV